MPSTYSNLKIQLMATGENATTWGNVTNVNLGTALEEAIAASADVTFASNNQTLTLADTNATQAARHLRLRCTGTTGGSTRNLVVPDIEKPYLVQNDCADAIVVKTSAGTGITVPAGKTMWVYADGTDVVDATTHLTSLTLGTALAVAQGGTGVTSSTGTGSVALSTSPTFVTPTLGAASATSIANALGAVGTPSYTFTGDLNTGMWSPAADTVAVSTAGSERMRITSGGDVGIGTSSPGALLDARQSADASVLVRAVNVNAGASADARLIVSNGTTQSGMIMRGTGHASANQFVLFQASATEPMTFFANGSERMRITSGGDVGIGTSSPSARLNVVDNSSNDAVRITQTGAGNALVVEDSASPDATPFVVRNNGQLLVRQAADYSISGGDFGVQTSSTGGSNGNSGYAGYNWANNAFGNGISFFKSRGNSLGTQGIVASGNTLGAFHAYGSDGVAFIEGASIVAAVDGTPGLNDMPGRLVFSTTADGSASPTERMRIDSGGDVGIGTSSPNVKLHVEGGSVRSSVSFIVSGAGSLQTAIAGSGLALNSAGSTGITFETGGSPAERMRITSTGDVGIGNTPSGTYKLEVTGATFASSMVLGAALPVASGGTGVTSSTGTGSVALSTSPTFVTPTLGAASATSIANGLGAVGTPAYTFTGDLNTGMWSPAADTVAVSTDGSERLRVTSGGDVGIGNTPSGAKLDVSGLIRARTSTATTDMNHDGSNGSLASSSSLLLYAGGANPFMVHTDNVERLRIDSAGDVGIGTNNPLFPLHVNGEVRGTKFTSDAGSQSLADNTDLTVLTLTGVTVRLFLVSINTNATAGSDMTVALVAVGTDGSGGAESTVTQLVNGATTDVTVANVAGTSTVSVKQTTGVTQTVSWSITRLM